MADGQDGGKKGPDVGSGPVDRPGGWEAEMVKTFGPAPLEEDVTLPPDLPPVVAQATETPSPPAPRGGKRDKPTTPYEANVPFVKAVVPPSVWDRCTWWWERQEALGTAAGQNLTLDQRLGLYLQHATCEHWLLDLRLPRGRRQYDWLASQAEDIAAVVAADRIAISDEAAAAQMDADMALVRDCKTVEEALRRMAQAKEELQ